MVATYYTVNVLTRWDACLREFSRDIREMSTDTLEFMRDHPLVRAELERRREPPIEVADDFANDEDDDDDVFVDVYVDDDFLPFGEDEEKLPKTMRRRNMLKMMDHIIW